MQHKIKAGIRFFFYPLMLLLGVVVAFWMKQKGLSESLVLAVVMTVASVVIFVFQKYFNIRNILKF